MIALGHSSVGAIVGLSVAAAAPGLPFGVRALIVLLLGVISHYVFDWLPHGHYHMSFKRMGLGMFMLGLADFMGFILLILGAAWLSFGFENRFWLIGVGILGAQAPDLWEIANQLGFIPQWRWVRRHRHFHHKVLHWHSRPAAFHVRLPRPIMRSDIWQVVVLIVALSLIIYS